ncbi:MAG: bifunctional 3-demethylubiquinol 3-O-methyltransferase/2-polyprenyl-6-hydroxyphenol methylase [Gammaproteobacteria bacterium RIFCSPHIGHO2_12_FULL_37_34]|nr:MAG: bifunctional 3-demethylubiquinol 3-O-methyltransferase/2-polyprenyl-6-hydroxyphenol methylase [Gammaproteobacteria bacterium RIFCSPHIGHO2_12_FULL_37_34]
MQHNYETQELDHFASLAPHWWDLTGPLKTLHDINNIRICYIKEKTNLNGKKIMDIGCGGGILAESMAKEGAIVTGIDLSSAVLQVASLHQLQSKTTVEYICSSAEAIAMERPASYDVITCLEILEHVPEPLSIIQACSRLVKRGGHLFFSTINRRPKAYFLAILGAEYFLKLLPKHTHDYAKFIRPSELSTWLRQAKLISHDMRGITYSPLTKQFRLSDDCSVNYLFYARRES